MKRIVSIDNVCIYSVKYPELASITLYVQMLVVVVCGRVGNTFDDYLKCSIIRHGHLNSTNINSKHNTNIALHDTVLPLTRVPLLSMTAHRSI